MRGSRFYSTKELPPEVLQIPGVRRVKTGQLEIPWHVYGVLSQWNCTQGLRYFKPPVIPSALDGADDPIESHPFLSERAKRMATPYQREDLKAALQIRGGLIDWPCISGDAEILINRGGNGTRIRLDDLVERFNGGGKRKWDLSIETRVQCMSSDGVLVSRRLEAALFKGIQPVYEVLVEGGFSVKGTAEHLFITPEGDRPLSALSPGDLVFVRGERTKGPRGTIREGRRQHYEVVPAIPHHPHASKWLRHRANRPNPYLESRVPKHRIVYEAVQLNGMTVEAYVLRLKSGDLTGLTFVDPERFDVHHKDGNTRNNAPENLELLPFGEHQAQHGKSDGWKNAQARTKPAKVLSVTPVGNEPVYDLIMESPYHNFVANGIVVHNCGSGKSLMGLSFATAFPNYRTVVVVPSMVVSQWREEALQWLRPDASISIGYVSQGQPDVKKVHEKVFKVTPEVRTALIRKGAPEVLGLRDEWFESQLSEIEIAHLKATKAPTEKKTTYRVLDDLKQVLGEHETREAAEEQAGNWTPGDYDILVIGWGLMSNPKVCDALLRWRPAVLVVDEVHRCKSTKRVVASVVRDEETGEETTKFSRLQSAAAHVQAIAKEASACLLLTATPQGDRPKDWWGVLDLYEPFSFGSFRNFAMRYCAAYEGEYGNLVADGLSNVEELKLRLSRIRFHRTKAETHACLPGLRRNFIALPLRHAGSVDMDALCAELKSMEMGGSGVAISIAVACEQKIPWAVDRLIEYLREGLKVVVFVLLKASVNRLFDQLNSHKDLPEETLVLRADGSVDLDARRGAISGLIESPAGGVLIGTVDALGESLNGMQHVDRAMVLTVPWTPQKVQQLEGRFDRIGGTKSVVVDYVRLKGTIDDIIWSRQGDKLKMVGEVRDDEDATALGVELKGESEAARSKALEEMVGLFKTWGEENKDKDYVFVKKDYWERQQEEE